MNKNKGFILFLVIFAVILIAGCGEKCPSEDEWDDGKSCTEDSCSRATDYEVRHIAVPGCTCGDGECDKATENKCTCSEDCGRCTGEETDYLKFKCDENNECGSDIKVDIISLSSTQVLDLKGIIKSDVVVTYEQPYNLDSSLFEIKFDIINVLVENLRITKLQLSATKDRQKITLGEKKDINRPVWKAGDEIIEEMIITYPLAADNKDGELKDFKLKIFYEYDDEYRGEVQKKRGDKELSFKDDIVYVNPGRAPECLNCDDNNPATKDICSSATNYFCKHTYLASKCRNYNCEGSENKCTCPSDCGPCEGEIGFYLSYTCYEDDCVVKVTDESDVEIRTELATIDVGVFEVEAKFTLRKPFNIGKDNFHIVFQLIDKNEELDSYTITKIRVLDGVELLTEKTTARSLDTIGDSFGIDIFLKDYLMKDPEAEKSLVFEVMYEYVDSRDNIVRSSYKKSFKEKFILINPDI